MPKQLSPDQTNYTKTYYVIGSYPASNSPGRFRAELEKVKLILKRKGHE